MKSVITMRTAFLEPRKLWKLREKFSTPISSTKKFAVFCRLPAFLFR